MSSHDEWGQVIERSVLAPTFVRAVFSGKQRGRGVPWMRVTVRPVEVRGERYTQFSYLDAHKDITKNYQGDDVLREVQELLALGFKNFYVDTTSEAIQINISKKGEVSVQRTGATDAAEPDLAHNRRRHTFLPEGKPDAFLTAVGIMTADGDVKAGMWNKYRQINEFLKMVDSALRGHPLTASPIRIIDFGCGNAYLSFAAYHYVNDVLGLPASLVGVDLKRDMIQRNRDLAHGLGWSNICFEAGRIIEFQAETAFDIVFALHACDTASDEALAQAIRMQSEMIFCAPCCHHHLQAQMGRANSPAAFQPVVRDGILKERMGDVLTDAFRAVTLRVLGYDTNVIQFVPSEHTAKNLMIRATKSAPSGELRYQQEYAALKAYWQVTPYLEQILDTRARQTLGMVDSAADPGARAPLALTELA